MRRGKSSKAIKKPVPVAREPARSRRGRGRGRRTADLVEEEDAPEPIPESTPMKRQDSWLDKLPPVVKPDAELHNQLSQQRRKAEEMKRLEICRQELSAIFNFAMIKRTLPNESTIPKLRADFLEGKFHDPNPEEDEDDQLFTGNVQEASEKNVAIKKLLEEADCSLMATMQSLAKSSSKSLMEFDSNRELNRLLTIAEREKMPYTNPNIPSSKANLPFLISIIGPPCSGKTTICQFISKFFLVKIIVVGENKDCDPSDTYVVIDSKDDKSTVASISEEISKTPENMGILLVGFPETKGQLTALMKALGNGKKKAAMDSSHFNGISGLIRTSMSVEEAEKQIQDRIIDTRNGTVFHRMFNPPSIDFEDCFAEVPVSEGWNANYTKISAQLAPMEAALKRTCPTLAVPACDTIGMLQKMVESFLKSLFTMKEMEPTFNTFVTFETHKKFLYAKTCADICNVWYDKCLPLFGKDLGDLYNSIGLAQHKIDYLYEVTRRSFELMIVRHDDRAEKAREFLDSGKDGGALFHYIWQESINLRDENIAKAAEFIHKCPLNALKEVLEENERKIFEVLVKRYLVVEWFTDTFAKIIDKQEVDDNTEIRDPVVPEFNVNSLRGLCRVMGIKEYSRKHTPKNKELKNNKSQIFRPRPVQLTGFADDPDQVIPLFSVKRPSERSFTSVLSQGCTPLTSAAITPRNASSKCDDDSLRSFLLYLRNETPKVAMKYEADVMLDMFGFFSSQKKAIDIEVDQHMHNLQRDIENISRRKCSQEMEQFSRNFRALKQGGEIHGPLFEYDTSFLNEECKELYERLNGNLPSDQASCDFAIEKLEMLYSRVTDPFITLTELLSKAEECSFTETECLSLRSIVLMNMIPDFIHTESFFTYICPDLKHRIDVNIEPIEPTVVHEASAAGLDCY